MERTRLCGLILRENFGDAVEQIGVYLMKNGARPLHSIIRDCKYDRATVSSYPDHTRTRVFSAVNLIPL